MSMKKVKVQHIGIIYALCDRRRRANLREDLGSARYRQLGVSERFKNDPPFRICARCIADVELRERSWSKWKRRRDQRK